jgi:deoxyribonuclease I
MKKFITSVSNANAKMFVNYKELYIINKSLTPKKIRKKIGNNMLTIEHIIPKSFAQSKCNSNRDLHLLTTYSTGLNSHKNNYVYSNDHTISNKKRLLDINGNVLNCIPTKNRNCISIKNDKKKTFTPADIYKGIISRSVMYHFVSYPKYKKRIFEEIIDIDVLINWHYTFPVTEEEFTRNLMVYFHQGNINPFILYPQLTKYVLQTKFQNEFNYLEGFDYNNQFYQHCQMLPIKC